MFDLACTPHDREDAQVGYNFVLVDLLFYLESLWLILLNYVKVVKCFYFFKLGLCCLSVALCSYQCRDQVIHNELVR